MRLLLAAALVCLPMAAFAQQRPSPRDAERILQTNPQIVEQLRQRIMGSGLTPDQVRARLRAEGYPENLLDAYLGVGENGDRAVADENVFGAVSALGLADSVDVTLLMCEAEDPGFAPLRELRLESAGDTAVVPRPQTEQRRWMVFQACRVHLEALRRGVVQRQVDIDSGFVIFGLETFRQFTTLFDPNLTGPVDAGYRLGPGDHLVLVLTGDVEASYQLEIAREGFIVIPQVGQIWVNNLTLGELENVLYSRLGRVYSGVRRGPGATTRFHITPSRLRSNQIFVHGDVMRPGSHRISSAGTAMSALYAAGGPTDNGSLRRIEIRRGGQLIERLDVYDYLVHGDGSRDIRLQNGDVVFVPIHGPRVRLVGEIARSATYELKEGETLNDAIRFAGGFRPTASTRRVQIERILPPMQRGPAGRDRIVTDVASEEFYNGMAPALPMYAGDVVRVFRVASRVRNRVTVRGNVWSPGAQGITAGVTRLSDVLQSAGGVKPDTYLGHILVARLQSDSTRFQLRSSLRDTLGTVANDFVVQEDDEIIVFSRSEFREPRYVAINGAVRNGGQYPYREGMTVRDLVLLAGGMEESALLREAEIARLPHDRTQGQTAMTFRVPLDSSYLFDRGPDGRYFGPPGLPAPNGPAGEVALHPYDNVLILRQPDWELQRVVAVTGEVRYPGKYALQTKTERMTDVIRRAGGLTREGHADGVVFYRTRDKVGRIGIELPQVLRNPRHRDNMILQDGDSIHIPRYIGIVHVQGEVNSPVAVAYVPGRDLQYYLRAAGGPAARADLSRAYVTQPNGKVEAVLRRPFFLPDGQPRPRPGSVIHVPLRDPADVGPDLAGFFRSTLGVISTLVATIAVARSL